MSARIILHVCAWWTEVGCTGAPGSSGGVVRQN